MNVSIDGLADAIEDILTEYDDNVKKDSKSSVRKVANKCKAQIKAAAPGTSYPGTWATKTTSRGAESLAITVYSKKPGLPHLLEHGHVLIAHGKVCGRVGARVHIKPAELEAIRGIEREIKRIL